MTVRLLVLSSMRGKTTEGRSPCSLVGWTGLRRGLGEKGQVPEVTSSPSCVSGLGESRNQICLQRTTVSAPAGRVSMGWDPIRGRAELAQSCVL